MIEDNIYLKSSPVEILRTNTLLEYVSSLYILYCLPNIPYGEAASRKRDPLVCVFYIFSVYLVGIYVGVGRNKICALFMSVVSVIIVCIWFVY